MSFEEYFLEKPICHRGLHNVSEGVIENSWEAIAASLSRELPIEIDLQNTKDGRAVIFHDYALKRLTGQSGRVRNKTLAEMENTALLCNGTIISFSECLKRVAARVPLLVEIKSQDRELGENVGSFINDIIESCKDYKGAIALMSFNPYIIQALRAGLPDASLGLVTCSFSKRDWPNVPSHRRVRLRKMHEVQFDFDFVSHDWTDLWRVRKLPKPVLCWTVKARWQEKIARLMADNITFENYMPKGA